MSEHTQGAGGREPGGRLPFERFEVQREVGKGGMATIYLAADREQPGRAVAMKVVHPHMAGDQQLIERFKHEVRAHVQLKHRNIVELIGWGQDRNGRLFMAMEFVDGPTLKDLMKLRPKFPADLAIFVTSRVLKGLAVAHERGLVHRDIKPANVMVATDGTPKLADFGISKAEDMTRLTSTGNVIGTPAYMSPEQAHGMPLDGRSDIFSVGVLLHELLTGVNPFHTDNPAVTLQKVISHRVPPIFETLPQTPARLESVLEKMLEKSPSDRIATTEEVCEELDNVVEEEGLSASVAAMARFVAEPDVVSRELDAARARKHFERGVSIHDGGKGSADASMWEFFVATLLDPGYDEPRNWLEQLSSQQGYSLKRRGNERIDELEQQLKEKPDDLRTILQLAKLHKAQGNFLQVIFYYKKARSLRPDDRYTQNQIETLVHPQAASILDGTGVFETQDGVPVALRAQERQQELPQVRIEPELEEGGLSGFLSSGLGKVVMAGMGVALVVILIGQGIDWAQKKTTTASGGSGSAIDHLPDGGAINNEVEYLQRAQEWASRGNYGQAEKVYRNFLDKHESSVLRANAWYGLGDALERLGRRPEALEAHGNCVEEGEDNLAVRCLEREAEIYRAEGDLLEARKSLDLMADIATGTDRVRAELGLAALERQEGRDREALRMYEEFVPQSRGTDFHDRVRLELASLYEDMGRDDQARKLYQDVQASTDHKSEEHAEARDGAARVGG
ncbi:MAG: serine/threonine-protein kinase [Acidobacteriota bacterium]